MKHNFTRRELIHLGWKAGLLSLLPIPTDSLFSASLSPVIERDNLNILHKDNKANSDRYTLLNFAHITDIHITDGTNPIRLEVFDNVPLVGSAAWRPQQYMSATAFDAAIRHINNQNNIDFSILTGDLVDNALEDEFSWVIDVADGNSMRASYETLVSANEMTPVNPEGFRSPWYVSIGNHDALVVGLIPHKLLERIPAINSTLNNYKFNSQKDIIEQLNYSISYPSGHGFTNMPDLEDGFYSFTPNGYVHCIVLNTYNDTWIEGLVDRYVYKNNIEIKDIFNRYSNKKNSNRIVNHLISNFLLWAEGQTGEVVGGISEGTIDRRQFKWIIKEIEDNPDKLCIIFSHHGTESFLSPPGNIMPKEFKETLAKYDNVIAHIYGHTHRNKITPVKNEYGGYWAINTCSLIEYPQEYRQITLCHNGDSTGTISCRMYQHNYRDSLTIAKNDPQAKIKEMSGKSEDRNVDLTFLIPTAVSDALQRQ